VSLQGWKKPDTRHAGVVPWERASGRVALSATHQNAYFTELAACFRTFERNGSPTGRSKIMRVVTHRGHHADLPGNTLQPPGAGARAEGAGSDADTCQASDAFAIGPGER